LGRVRCRTASRAPLRRRRRRSRGRLGRALADVVTGLLRRSCRALLESADSGGIWTIQTSVFPENEASLALHERVGFRVVGRRERIAELDGVWRDTILLERRV
jgi:L-amino acid N-acyltransferase YncA